MSICVVDGGPCQCQPSEGCPCPGVAALHAKDSIRTREHNLLVAENRSQAAEIAALRAEVAGLREWLEADARCPCCDTTDACVEGCTFATDCPQDAERMAEVRALLAARKGNE